MEKSVGKIPYFRKELIDEAIMVVKNEGLEFPDALFAIGRKLGCKFTFDDVEMIIDSLPSPSVHHTKKPSLSTW